MQIKETNINNLLEQSAKIRRLVMGRNVLLALYKLGNDEWERSYNELTSDHLIKGVSSSNTKTEVIRSYVGKLVKLHMNSLGNTGSAWTKDSIAEDHVSGMLNANKLATTIYKNHDSLFKDTVSRLLGYDPDVVMFSIKEGNEAAFFLVKHLVCSLDLASVESRKLLTEDKPGDNNNEFYLEKFNKELVKDFNYEIGVFESLLDKGELNEEFFYNLNSVIMNSSDLVESNIVEPDLLGSVMKVFNKVSLKP